MSKKNLISRLAQWQTRKMMRPVGLPKGRFILNPPG